MHPELSEYSEQFPRYCRRNIKWQTETQQRRKASFYLTRGVIAFRVNAETWIGEVCHSFIHFSFLDENHYSITILAISYQYPEYPEQPELPVQPNLSQRLLVHLCLLIPDPLSQLCHGCSNNCAWSCSVWLSTCEPCWAASAHTWARVLHHGLT